MVKETTKPNAIFTINGQNENMDELWKTYPSIERLPTIFKLGNPNAPATQSNFVVLPVPEGP